VEVLRESLPIPVIGLEPALKPAVEATPEGKILILATELTLKEEKFRRLYESYRDRGDIILQSCPGLVELIDAGQGGQDEVAAYLDRLFAPLDRAAIRTVVLGCTHYVIIRREILARFLPGTLGLDGNEGVARHLADVLNRLGRLNRGPAPGRVELLSSDSAKTAMLEDQYRKLAGIAPE
jgi:glutamate racemase